MISNSWMVKILSSMSIESHSISKFSKEIYNQIRKRHRHAAGNLKTTMLSKYYCNDTACTGFMLPLITLTLLKCLRPPVGEVDADRLIRHGIGVTDVKNIFTVYVFYYYLRQVNEVNGGDNVFVRCLSVCVCVCLCVCARAQRPVDGS